MKGGGRKQVILRSKMCVLRNCVQLQDHTCEANEICNLSHGNEAKRIL